MEGNRKVVCFYRGLVLLGEGGGKGVNNLNIIFKRF